MQGRKSLIVALAVAVTTVVLPVSGENDCEKRTCSECIGAPTCAWCSLPNITSVELDSGGTLSHCISSNSFKYEKFLEACKGYITNPVSANSTKKDEELSDDPIVQLKPQHISLEMRAGDSTRITVKYKHLSSYQLDLYCLMDGSKSMSTSKEELASVTSKLVADLEKLSNNMRLGFGMFVDKPVLPYTDMLVWSQANCRGCVESFSFKHILPMTDDREKFEDKVRNTNSSTNVDRPEGTLDALMQVVSCENKVGWRRKSLKVVVVFTDAGFHVAGDGKLAGIALPNDMQCHLDSTGQYTYSKLQDYPSIGELQHALETVRVYTTFAVKEELLPVYSMLTSRLPHSDCGVINNSSDIVNLITNFAKEIISTVELNKPKDIMEGVAVTLASRCKGNEEKASSTCKGMSPGDEAEFFIDIEVKSCPQSEHLSTTLNFTLDGYSQFFILDLKLLCQCECEKQSDQEFIPDADECSNKGDLTCGVCSCQEGFLGDKCQCKEGDLSNQEIDEKNCIQPNTSTSLVCSGQGECVCGTCKCNERLNSNEVITGQYCQCTNYKNCYGANGDICSGHGECQCDKCLCNQGWEGEFCDCQKSTAECQVSDEEEICSSHGKCVCNQCQCEEGYLGKYCEDCQNCEENCHEYTSCVKCLVSGSEAACNATCSGYDVTIVSDMSKVYGLPCSSTSDDECRIFYQFKHKKGAVSLWIQKQKECPEEINVWAVMGGILGAVVVVGLLLLIAWKIVTHFKDKREYETFMKNRSMAIWSEVSKIKSNETTLP
ncbi:LOW QUALITY PROTEIN: integrin beta-PS-like [Portunus trituberculatus]|uniref:LOW QUALITY PROTEIN: integrin beta-PS-like n=1 Tax=Portunus trituberculatus TaxID=210409 RepID=UPI001E1CC701|nr:LOW QUALITY PROTEIN: integrin beta-PS-like [Portunus trituberculatus]